MSTWEKGSEQEGEQKRRRGGEKEPFMGMERTADYPSSVLWRASLFTTTLGLHGFAHLHLSSHTQTHQQVYVGKNIFVAIQVWRQLELMKFFQGANWNYHLEASGYCQPAKLEFKSVLVQTHMTCGLKTWIGGPQKLVSLFQHLIKCKMCSQSKSSAPQLWNWIMAKVLLSGNFEVTVTFSQFILESKWMLMSDIRSQQPREALEIIKTIFYCFLYVILSIHFLPSGDAGAYSSWHVVGGGMHLRHNASLPQG